MSAAAEAEAAPEDVEEGAPSWVLTFADLMSLLLCFFVLMFSMAEIKREKFQAAAMSLRASLTGEGGEGVAEMTIDPTAETKISVENLVEVEMLKILAEIRGFIKQEKLESRVKADVDARGCIITIQDDYFFPQGDVAITEAGRPLMKRLSDLLEKFPYAVRVEGHTDNVPIRTERYPSNWELSAGRATTVVREFIKYGIDPTRLSAEGFAEFRPLVPNKNRSARARNRRVEIIYKRENMVSAFRDRFPNHVPGEAPGAAPGGGTQAPPEQ